MIFRFLFALLIVVSSPTISNAGWVFIPDSVMYDSVGAKPGKIRIFNAGTKFDVFFPAPTFDPVTLAQIPYQDFMLDTATNVLVPLTQTNIVNYGLTQPSAFFNAGSIIAGVNEAAIAQTFTDTAPWILWAYLTGWLVALPFALGLNFVRGRVNSSV